MVDKKELLNQIEYQALFDSNPNPVYLFDLEGNFVSINQSGSKALGLTSEEVVNLNFLDLVIEEDRFRAWEGFVRATKGEQVTEEVGVIRQSRQYDIISTKIPMFKNGTVIAVFVIAQDITELKQLQQGLLESGNLMRTLIDAMPDFFCLKDGEGRWITSNDFGRKLFEIESVDYKGKTDNDLAQYTPFFASTLQACTYFDEQAWKARKVTRSEERLPNHDGSEQIFDTIKVPMFHSDGSRKGLLVMGRDITERVVAEQSIERMAYYDSLTDLPNRALFQKSLKKILDNRNNLGGNAAVMFIDLDGFKNINDTMGHSTGDKLLKKVAERLRRHLTDEARVYRIGGDEFIVLLPELEDPKHAEDVAIGLLKALERPWHIEGDLFHVTASVGVAIAPLHGSDAENLMKNADMAMYLAKEKGKNNYQVYSDELNKRTLTRVSIEEDLRHAIMNNELELYYQPIVNANTRQVVEAEALIRWNRPDFGMVSPIDFISIAEMTGLIVPIGEWVLRNACEQAKTWADQKVHPIRICVNLSSRQFEEPLFLQTVKKIIKETNVAPEHIGLEITESLIVEDVDYACKTLTELGQLGIKISIDDFGTGYSSLAYLKKFPVHKLKIDQAFVRDIIGNPDDEAITNTIIALAKNLSMSVVAEGVETEEQFLVLKEKNCDEVQGYLFSKPIPAQEFEKSFLSK